MINNKGIDLGSRQCTCPKCGLIVKHATRGIPCGEKKCPRCGSAMLGEPCLESGKLGTARMMKFVCGDCGLMMVFPKRPVSCITCGGSNIVRDGWKANTGQDNDRSKCEKEGK
jgi:hypothetical protein